MFSMLPSFILSFFFPCFQGYDGRPKNSFYLFVSLEITGSFQGSHRSRKFTKIWAPRQEFFQALRHDKPRFLIHRIPFGKRQKSIEILDGGNGLFETQKTFGHLQNLFRFRRRWNRTLWTEQNNLSAP